MSSVRMCDRCGSVFSELADGWQSYSATTVLRRKKGETGPAQTMQTVQMDACPSCAIAPPQDPPALTALAGENDHAFARLALEREVAELREQLAAKQQPAEPEPTPAPVQP
jgi:hypothetical protein